MRKRGAIELDTLGYAIIAVVVLAIIIVGIFLLQGKGSELLDKIKDIFRFGR
jgi:uncharacterized protein (UPF0333 family)